MNQKNLTYFYIDIILIGLLICATIVLNLVMIRDGLNGMTDMKWHITWLQHFYKGLTEGIWYPRWLAGTNYGYGSPTFVFYPPLVFYLGSLFKFMGLSTENTIVVLFSLALFLSGFNFYLLGFKNWGKLPSFIGGLFYMSTPYLAFDIYYRSGLASIFIQAWIPLLLLTTKKTLVERKYSISLTITWVLISFTHTPSLLLCTIIWFLYIILLLPENNWKNIVNSFLATFLGWGIASLYLIPAIMEKSFVNISILKNVYGGFKNALIGTSLPLFPLDFQNSLNIPFIFIHQFLAITIFFLIATFCLPKNNSLKSDVFLWFVIAIALAFLMSGLSQPIWESSLVLQMVQFPWRFMQFFSVIGAIMCALAIKSATKTKFIIRSLILLLVLVLMLANFRYGYKLSRQFITINYSGKGNTEHLNHIKDALNSPYQENLRDVPEYRPLLSEFSLSPPEPIIEQPKLSVLNGQAFITLKKWHSYLREFSVNANTISTIGIRTYYYPAWHLYIDDRLYPYTKHTDGTIAFKIQPGIHNVKLIYQTTRAFLLGIIISVISLIFLAIHNVFLFKNKRILDRNSNMYFKTN